MSDSVDTFRLNALVNELMDPGEDFDPAVAREIYDSLPMESVSPVSLEYRASGDGKGFSGQTNAGSFSFKDGEDKRVSIGNSRGTWVGKWRLIRTGRRIIIERRFESDPSEPADMWRLCFDRLGGVRFLKSKTVMLMVPLPWFSRHVHASMNFHFIRMKPWKTARPHAS